MTLVSVIVPVHDGERFLKEALDSVLAQDYRPVEVIVVDDGSTDRSAEIARSVPGVTVIGQEQGGPSAARNAGIARARGEYVAFLDADDLMLPHKLSAQAAFLTGHPWVGCVLARQEVRIEDGVQSPPWLRRDRLIGDPWGIQPLSGMIRRRHLEEIGGFDETLTHAEDQDLLFRLREAGVEIEILDRAVSIHRVHGKNLTYGVAAARDGLLRSLKGRIEARRRGQGDLHVSRHRPSVSVVIPSLNGEHFLGQAIESVLAQGYEPMEIIVVDDGSTDDTARVARSFPMVTYLRQEHAGISAARNLGVATSTGSLLAFLDHDDLWERGKLETQVRVLERDSHLDAVLGHVTEFFSPDLPAEDRARLRTPHERTPGLNPGALLIHRGAFDRVGPFDTRWTVAEWVDWYARAQERGLRFEILPDVVLRRRLHGRNQGIREARSRAQYVQAVKAALDRRRAGREV